jgi:hypothetical protein
MHSLVKGLQNIEKSRRFAKEYLDVDSEVTYLSALASDTLINRQGRPDMDMIDAMIEAGYDVFAGERDRFGWLSGCIQTKKGILVFF